MESIAKSSPSSHISFARHKKRAGAIITPFSKMSSLDFKKPVGRRYSEVFPLNLLGVIPMKLDNLHPFMLGVALFFLSCLIIGGISLLNTALIAAVSQAFAQIPKTSFLFALTFLTWQPILYLGFFSLGISGPVRDFALEKTGELRGKPWQAVLLVLFSFKFIKVFVHLISYILYRPLRLPQRPKYTAQDVTVVIPTVADFSCEKFLAEWTESLASILINNPSKIVISVVGANTRTVVANACDKIRQDAKDQHKELFQPFNTEIVVVSVEKPDKRAQSVIGAAEVRTMITCVADDHIFWPPTFLKNAVANFEIALVGLVGTSKRVRRVRGASLSDSILNYIAVIYLERHNFEFTSSNNIDGGVSVISGRTYLIDTDILHLRAFQYEYLHETLAFGNVGPLKVDDDNFITRFVDKLGYKIVFHNSPETLIETNLGVDDWKKFGGQLMRWARSTYRSNFASLVVDRTCWRRHPWTTYGSYISPFFNLAIIYDPALFFAMYKGGEPFTHAYYALGLVLFLSKLIKPLPHLWRTPRDIPFLFVGIAFGYVHSLIRIWAFLTQWNIEWSGRQGIEATGHPDEVELPPISVASLEQEEQLASQSVMGEDKVSSLRADRAHPSR
ncbi:hypothetical protein PVAG01_06827 [Phlyctema vagabunda]|uniref:Glycosyltransferase family 2 protein n=1 Tax=Phlyctema vagabunda TaxID=108571 RepID=A0ABR4PH65_9HELO